MPLVNENRFHYHWGIDGEVMMFEKLLGTLMGSQDGSRVEIVQLAEPGETPALELRLLHDCGELGWTVHKRIGIAAGQVAELRDALNMMDLDAREAKTTQRPSHLRLVGFEEAL